MNRLTKERVSERDALASKLTDARADLDKALSDFNTKMQEAFGPVEAAREAYNAVVGEANTYIETVKGDQENHYNDKTEKWQDGEKGQAYSSWMEAFDLQISEIDGFEPDPVEYEEPDYGAEDLSNLPEEPS